MKITFLDASTMGDVSLECIGRLGLLTCWPTSTREEALERVSDCEVLIINKVVVDRELIDAAKSLRLICEAATGVNNIDLEYAASKGIPVRNVAAYSTDSVVQQTFMHLFSLLGNGPYFDERVKNGTYSSLPTFTDVSRPFVEAAGKTIGIIGMGAIGQRTAALAQAFGCRVIAWNRTKKEVPDVTFVDKETLLKESDIVALHIALNNETRDFLTAKDFALMKKSAVIVNAARGPVVNTNDLAEALKNGTIAGAALDVYDGEPPLKSDNPLLTAPNTMLLPHIGFATREAFELRLGIVVRNVEEFVK